LDLSLQIVPVGDTTAREIAAASEEVRDVLERFRGVERVEPQRTSAPDQTKGGLTEVLGALVVSVAPVALKALLQAVQTVLARRASATKVLIKTKEAQVSFEFDPRRISLQELVSAAERLGVAAPPA
jgi:hypothetical protein